MSTVQYLYMKFMFIDLTKIMSNGRDFWKLLQIWKGWYDASTAGMKPLYKEFVDLENQQARAQGMFECLKVS